MTIQNSIISLTDEVKDFEHEHKQTMEELSDVGLESEHYDFEEVVNSHPTMYRQAVMDSVQAKRLLNRAELLVKELKAGLSIELRKERDEAGLKTTEALLTDLIDTSEEAKQARGIRADCQSMDYEASMILSVFEHRRSMINNKTSLIGFQSAVGESNISTMNRGLKKRKRLHHE